ncbi:hypothetical protein ACLOJK_015085, partial [Asimina triloba]
MSPSPIYRRGAAEFLVGSCVGGSDRLWVVRPHGGMGVVPVPAARHRGPSGRYTGGGALQYCNISGFGVNGIRGILFWDTPEGQFK